MLSELMTELDEAIETDDFIEITNALTGFPLWKIACLYIYSFFLGGKGKKYRKCIKYLKFPYYLRYKLLVGRCKRWICGKT